MADLIITAASVGKPTNASPRPMKTMTAPAGVAITAGQAVYVDANGNVQLSNAASNLPCHGVAFNSAPGVGQLVTVITEGDYAAGSTLTKAVIYAPSGTAAGGIAPVADYATGWRCQVLGQALDTANLRVGIVDNGVVK